MRIYYSRGQTLRIEERLMNTALAGATTLWSMSYTKEKETTYLGD